MKTAILAALGAALALSSATVRANDLFVTRSSSKPPAELHEAVKRYAADRKWLYIGDNKLKNGEVTQVRLCIREAAADIWKAGMHLAAMLPCGQFAIYMENGATKLTLMHPRYMTLLDPHPLVRKLADDVSGPFVGMLEEVSK